MGSHGTSTSSIPYVEAIINIEKLPPDERAAYATQHLNRIIDNNCGIALLVSLIPEKEQLSVLQSKPNLITNGSELAFLIRDLHMFEIPENYILSFLYLNLDKIKSADDMTRLFRYNPIFATCLFIQITLFFN